MILWPNQPLAEVPVRFLIAARPGVFPRSFVQVLVRAGLRVALAESVTQAGAKLKSKRCHVLLFDSSLEVELHPALLNKLTSSSDPTPVVIFASEPLKSDRVIELFGWGVLALPKPLRPQSLVRLVRLLAQRAEQKAREQRGFCGEHAFSPREVQVVQAAAAGLQNKEISTLLLCGESTVMTYWKRIFAKTGCRSRSELLGLLMRCPQRSNACAVPSGRNHRGSARRAPQIESVPCCLGGAVGDCLFTATLAGSDGRRCTSHDWRAAAQRRR